MNPEDINAHMSPQDINGVRVDADEYDFDNAQFLTFEYMVQQKVKMKNLSAQHGGVVDATLRLKFKDGFELGKEHELYETFFAQYIEFVVHTNDCVIIGNDEVDTVRCYMNELARYRKEFGELPVEQDFEGANYD